MLPPDAATARRLVDAQFPEYRNLALVEMSHQGWDNRSYQLGSDLVVRLPSGPGYQLQVAKEQRWLPVLAAQLSLPIPEPVALGRPDDDYPLPWAINRFVPGVPFASAPPSDRLRFAHDLGAFLVELRGCDTAEAPGPGDHNAYRGASLDHYEAEALAALNVLAPVVDEPAIRRAWDAARASEYAGAPVWVHGDVAAGNVLTAEGSLGGVIDFGCCGVGDPACDGAMAWVSFDAAERAAFREAWDVDDATWHRARGWVIWKALITHDAPESKLALAAAVSDAP